jgi:broad specificity phosphatase PhoE
VSAVVLRERVREQVVPGPVLELDPLRHGESTFNRRGLFTGARDVPLTPRGREQAATAGERLAPAYALAVCSPLDRSVQTLKLALAATGTRVAARALDPRLAERSLGALEGTRETPLAAHAHGDLGWRPAGGESYLELAHRVLGWLLDLRDRVTCAGHARVLVCSHLGPLRVLVALGSETADPRARMAAPIAHAEPLPVRLGRVPWPAFLEC